jgi:hypothetical protein
MSQLESKEGGCQCGAVRYRATLDLAKPVISCNCSMCGRSGTLLTFIPATSFELLSGEDALTDYQFGKKHIHHLFCRTCGIKSFARGAGPDGNPMVAINTRCLDGIEVGELNVQPFDGRSR